MADKTDIYKAIRAIAVADTTLTAMLGSSTEFYYGADIALNPTAPFIVLREMDDVPMTNDSFWGDFRPRVEMHVCGPDPGRLMQIVERLDTLFIIPFKRATVIETTTHVVRQMLRRSALQLPMAQREADDRVFQQIVTEWELKVTAKS